MEEPVAKSKTETEASAKADGTTKSTPKPLRVEDRTGGDWEVSNRIGSWQQMRRKMMEADVQDFSQATTEAVGLQNTMALGSTPVPVCGRAAET